ncbi:MULTISPECIES: STAS domain-containing protein [unclassified Streptomyces]|uniref:STAS domain-containing protein n=1 Tax=unclassified Streptomyces TaxID=2593676 RepID=UPI0022B65B66|nr:MULTISPECIES: STAS domain-containing protein [unclassified Streptomyces]MCZ7414946.1 STAS domain-containing protein [Streptomyces sp. WMMC897]MCZ7431889.1 STAS domain-containing protein [Streptomyces sp. WMMC1477]
MYSDTDSISLTDVARTEGCALVRVAGKLDVSTERQLQEHAGTLVDAGHHHLVLDLTALGFCDSRGLNCLLSLNWLCRRLGGQLLLAAVGSRVLRMLTLTGTRHVFHCYPTPGAALAAVPSEQRPVWPPAV